MKKSKDGDEAGRTPKPGQDFMRAQRFLKSNVLVKSVNLTDICCTNVTLKEMFYENSRRCGSGGCTSTTINMHLYAYFVCP